MVNQFSIHVNLARRLSTLLKYAPETTPDELAKLVGSDEVIKEAYEALDSAYWTENELMLYEQEMKSENDALSMLRQAELEGMEKGREEGNAKLQVEKLASARKLKKAGVPISVIADSLGLAADAIEKVE